MSIFDLNRIIDFVAREPWRERFDAVLGEHFSLVQAEFDLGHQDIIEMIGDEFYFMLVAFALDDLLSRRVAPDGVNLADDYLKRRGYRETATAKRYLQALRDSTLSLYEISDIVAGQSFVARDLIRGGEPVLITERTATKTLQNGDRLAVRVLALNGSHVLSGGVVGFSLPVSMALLARIEELAGSLPIAPDHELLAHLAPIFATQYLMGLLALAEPVVTGDGEAVELHRLTFPLAKGATQKDIAAKFDLVPALRKDDSRFWHWIDADAQGAPGTIGFEISTMLETGEVIVGDLELFGRSLVLSTLSALRADKGRALIEASLGALVDTPTLDVETLDDIRDATDPAGLDFSGGTDGGADIVPTVLDAHYRKTLDDTVPMLGGRSPRAAVKTEAGKAAVADWLKYLEDETWRLQTPGMAYDFTWMWDELGIMDLRR